ncbi:MAG: TraC family protein [Methyloprofundus sp.]|nr:TraC family protein [Methyloprofundus sp.]
MLESTFDSAQKWMDKQLKTAVNWLKIDPPGLQSTPQGLIENFAERRPLSSVLYYRDVDDDGLIFIDDGREIRLGFMIEFTPYLSAGTDSELQIATILTAINVPDTIMQFGILSHPMISPILDKWGKAKQHANDPMIDAMADFRRNYFLSAAYKTSLIEGRESHPKDHSYLLTVTLPYKGDHDDEYQWRDFKEMVLKSRSSIIGVMNGAKLPAIALNRTGIKFYLRILANPHLSADSLARTPYDHKGVADIVMKGSRLSIDRDGLLDFSASDDMDSQRKSVVCMTMDGYPKQNYLPLTAKLIGDFVATNDNIPYPFWMYLNVRLLDSGKTKDKLTVKLAGISRQLVSDSPAYQAIMSHLFEQRDQTHSLIRMSEDGNSLVTSYMGLNIFAPKKEALNAAKNVTSMWAGHAFRGSQETFISFPIWFSSLPGLFVPDADPTNFTGLQRSSTMATKHVSTLAPIQGDWKGTNPADGGLLLTSRRGQLATVNIMDKHVVTNYNFTVVAASGMGKSFVAQEIVTDFLSKGGLAFVIDAGRSYYEMCELIGGTNLVFSTDKPYDINPFAQIKTEFDLKEFTEMLKELIAYMAWPKSIEGGVPDWEYVLLEHAIEDCWHQAREKTTMKDIRAWLYAHEDVRAKDIADQLRPYTEGRLAAWFDGTGAPIDLGNRFVVIELDDLKSQGAFRDVVLTMMMQRIANAMYKTQNPDQPKLMLIDEGWDLLASNQAAGFINRAYRTYRKFGGSAGVITQSFGDFQMSAAAKAAWDNSAWLFALGQKAESLEAAFKSGLMVADELTQKLLSSVHTIPGKYSEIFVRCGGGSGVYRFISDRYTYWLYTSNGTEKAIRKKRYESIMDKDPALSYQQAMSMAIAELADEDYAKTLGDSPRKIIQNLGVDV